MEALKRVSRLLTLIKDLLTLLYVHFGPRILTQEFWSIAAVTALIKVTLQLGKERESKRREPKEKKGKGTSPCIP